MGIKKRILSFLIPPLGAFLLRVIYFTCRVHFNGKDFPNSNCIYATWHGELVMTPFCYKAKQSNTQNISVITSPHFDGQLIGKIIHLIVKKATTIDGSSSKNAAKALISAMRILKTPNNNIAISPDGPRGPRHSIAQGVVVLSQRLNIPIVTVNCKASSSWIFNSWDKMFLPKPFSRLDFFIGEPFLLGDLQMEEAKLKIKEKLMENANV